MKHPIIIMGVKCIGKQNFVNKDLLFTKVYLKEDSYKEKYDDWTTEYLIGIMHLYSENTSDFIFVDYSDEMMDLMIQQEMKFVVVAPYYSKYNADIFIQRFYDSKYNHYDGMTFYNFELGLFKSLKYIKDKDKHGMIDVIWMDKSQPDVYDLKSVILQILKMYLNDDLLY